MSEIISSRDVLTERILPKMKLSDGSAASITAPPPPMPNHLDAAARAATRFEVRGNAIITGGAGTLALECARALLEHGLDGLALFDLNPSHSSQAIELLRDDFPLSKVITKTVNVTDADAIKTATAESAEELHGINILCCFAGIVGCTHAIDMSPEEWRRTLDINTTGAFLCAQAAAKHVFSLADAPTSLYTTLLGRG